MTKLSQLNIELAQSFIDFNPDYTFFALKRQFFQFGALKVDIFFKNIGYNFNGMKIRVRSIQTPPLKKFKWVNILGGWSLWRSRFVGGPDNLVVQSIDYWQARP